MTVNQTKFQNAFNLAHRASEDENMSSEARAIFRAISRQLWLACGADSERMSEQLRDAIGQDRS